MLTINSMVYYGLHSSVYISYRILYIWNSLSKKKHGINVISVDGH